MGGTSGLWNQTKKLLSSCLSTLLKGQNNNIRPHLKREDNETKKL